MLPFLEPDGSVFPSIRIRLPANERAVGLRFLSDQAAGYISDGASQKSPADASLDSPLGSEAAQRQSLVDFCLVLLNSAEFLYVD